MCSSDLSLFVKWNSKNHLLISFVACIFPKKSPFLPQNGQFCFFSYLHYFLVSGRYFRYKHRPKSADKPACIDLSCSYNALSKINSKCDRAFVAPPEFKSLMLRQSTVQRAFLSTLYRFFMQKTEFLSLTISLEERKRPVLERNHTFLSVISRI